MEDLEITHPSICQRFQQGYHVVRKSDRDWAGLSTDLAIEQDLMRNLKSSGTYPWRNEERIDYCTAPAMGTDDAIMCWNEQSYATLNWSKI